MRILHFLVALMLPLVGVVAIAQSGWVQMTNSAQGQASGSTGGLLGLPTTGAYDNNIAQISWAHQGGRGPFLSFESPQNQWVMIVPMDDGSLWRSINGGQTLAKVFASPYAASGSRPQHAVRLPNGAIYIAYAPTSNDVGMLMNNAYTATMPVPSCGAGFDPRYEVFRSPDNGLTWEDTNLATINGISVAGSECEVNWGGWWTPDGNLYNMDLGVYTWTDPGLGTAWSSISVNNSQTSVGSSWPSYMMWTESFRSGGSSANNFLTSTLTHTSMYTMVAGPAGTCGGVDNTRDSLSYIDPAGTGFRDEDWQGINHCNGGDNIMEPSRGGSVTAWDNPATALALCIQGKNGNGYPNLMGMFDATGAPVGPGGNVIAGYQHSVASVGGSLALTYANQVYTSGDQGATWTQISTTLAGAVDPTGSFPFPAGNAFSSSRICLANLNSSNYSDRRLIALTQDAEGATAKGTTRVWVYTDTPTIPAIQVADNGIQASGFSACSGDSVTFTVVAPSTDLENDPIEYQWQISPDGNIWVNLGTPSTSMTYAITVGPASAAAYRVVASSSLNGVPLAQSVSSPFSLLVSPAPGFASLPAPLTSCSGGDQVLAYSVTGPPNATFTISIFMNGANVPVAALKNASGSTPATVALGGSGFGSFVVFVPGSLLTNSLGTGYSAFYSFNATITSM